MTAPEGKQKERPSLLSGMFSAFITHVRRLMLLLYSLVKRLFSTLVEYFHPRGKSKKKPSLLSGNMALVTGLVMGVLAAVIQGFFDLQPPAAAGICGISHPANLINWLANNNPIVALRPNPPFTIHSIFVAVPVLTSVGFIIGGFAAAVINKEFKFRPGPVRDNVLAFILGFIIVNFGLLWGSCPIRTTVLAAYGMPFAMLILGCIVLGVVVACEYIKWKVRRVK